MEYAILALGGFLWAAGYAIACWVWPFADCTRCQGKGTKRSPTGRAFRTCKRCKGTGKRTRTGRRIFNWLHVLSQDGSR